MSDHPAQRRMGDPVGSQLPGTFQEAARLMGHPPADLRPSEYRPGVWLRVDARGVVRNFRWVDSVDEASPGYRPGGKYRTWREDLARRGLRYRRWL